eukprot:TRINITY_DN5438_c0_g1_i2.p1 TRINITY_DN5438_c0_g1~~TRINITY_DN5438_c0_g1_i2.p1  ORF type:complete len:148 (+),score=15.53 TRINITY_DN5438_c0_g1_i2:1-444(+)
MGYSGIKFMNNNPKYPSEPYFLSIKTFSPSTQGSKGTQRRGLSQTRAFDPRKARGLAVQTDFLAQINERQRSGQHSTLALEEPSVLVDVGSAKSRNEIGILTRIYGQRFSSRPKGRPRATLRVRGALPMESQTYICLLYTSPSPRDS